MDGSAMTATGPSGDTTSAALAPSRVGAIPATVTILEAPATREAPATPTVEQRLRAIDTLLANPEAIPDPLEVELYAYREQITEGTAA
jgi:hypothetical protein